MHPGHVLTQHTGLHPYLTNDAGYQLRRRIINYKGVFIMRKPELAAAIAESADLSKDKAGQVLNVILDEITHSVAKGDDVALIGFGTFTVRERAARTGKNPQTGEPLQIPASKNVAFKPGKALKDAVS